MVQQLQARLPEPWSVRQHRAIDVVPLPDVWDTEAVGLGGGPQGARVHAKLHLRSGRSAPERDAETGATSYLDHSPVYLPYESARVPLDPEGWRIGWQVVKAAYNPEILDAVLDSPVISALVAAQATSRACLSPHDRGRALAGLAAIAPKKGSE